MKRLAVWVILSLIVLLGLGTGLYAVTNDFQLGRDIQIINSSPDNEYVIATINGIIPITLAEFEVRKILFQANGQSKSNADIIQALVEEKMVYEEAKRRGITVSDQEFENAINFYKESFKELDKPQNAEAKKQMDEFFAGLGMSAKDYWEDPVILDGYRTLLYRAKLLGQVSGEIDRPDGQINPIEEMELVEARMRSFAQGAQVEIIDDKYK